MKQSDGWNIWCMIRSKKFLSMWIRWAVNGGDPSSQNQTISHAYLEFTTSWTDTIGAAERSVKVRVLNNSVFNY